MHLLCTGLYFIGLLKLIFQEQRPFQINSSLSGESSGAKEWSYPSGHSYAAIACINFFYFKVG